MQVEQHFVAKQNSADNEISTIDADFYDGDNFCDERIKPKFIIEETKIKAEKNENEMIVDEDESECGIDDVNTPVEYKSESDDDDDDDDNDKSKSKESMAKKSNLLDETSSSNEIQFIKANLLFLNHQMSTLLRAFNIKPCSCCHCNTIQFSKKNKEDDVSVHGVDVVNAYSSEKDFLHFDRPIKMHKVSNDCEKRLNKIRSNGENVSYFTAKRGRKSKYCSPTQKKAVAGYAQAYGASAAARKFNIPPAVAAYYFRKEYKSFHHCNNEANNNKVVIRSNFINENNNNKNSSNKNSTSSPKNSKEISAKGTETCTSRTASMMNTPAVSGGDPTTAFNNLKTQESKFEETSSSKSSSPLRNSDSNNENVFNEFDSTDPLWNSLEKNATHSGSPGFLRGRGRGRPKLIGDELDAELVEYMVQQKVSNPRQHLTAAQALHIARGYILEKAPGLLEEHGGQIKLKLTWAMKLVSRIQEREREIQLGLPAGSLQNMGKTNLSNLPNGLMNELMAQNFFGQQNNKSLETSFPAESIALTTSATPISNNKTFVMPSFDSSSNVAFTKSMFLPLSNENIETTSTLNSMNMLSAKSLNSIDSTSMAASMASFFNKLPIEQMARSFDSNTDLFDPALLLAELGVGSVEELAHNELFKTLVQSLNRKENPTSLQNEVADINNQTIGSTPVNENGLSVNASSADPQKLIF